MDLAVGPLHAKTWTGILHEVERRLFDLLTDDRAYLVLNTRRPDGCFVQFAVDHGTLSAETSAAVLGGPTNTDWCLVDSARAEALVALGWRPPVSDPLRLARPGAPSPNFHRTAEVTAGSIPALFADLTVHTLHDVWQVQPSEITIRSGVLASLEDLSRC